MCGQPILSPIRLKRHDNIQQRAALENTVMQIASSDIFPAANKEGSPKVSAFERNENMRNIINSDDFWPFPPIFAIIKWKTNSLILCVKSKLKLWLYKQA